MQAGKLDKLVVFQSRAATLDAYGQKTGAWSDVASVWAGIRPVTAREALAAREVTPTLTHAITVRYDDRLVGLDAAALRIVLGSRVFNPGPPRDVDEAGVALVFDCTEGAFVGD
jgi:SPP1 family predicted phage head-tail adaptor